MSGADDPGTDLTIAISTLGPRLPALELPPPAPGLRYLLLVQEPPVRLDGLAFADRPDVTLRRLPGRGLARSRNAALEMADTPFLLFSDDDIALDLSGIGALRDQLAARPELAFATGRRAGRDPDRYPATPQSLNLRNSGKTATPELMLRPARFRDQGLAFDADFGLGARWPLGEEYVFLADALRAGLQGWFFPIDLGRHAHPSTGDVWTDPALLAARMAVLRRVFGRWAPLVRVAYGWRHRRRLGGIGGGLRFIFGQVPDVSGS